MIAALLAFCLAISTSKFWRWDYNPDPDISKYQVLVAQQVPTWSDCIGDDGEPSRCAQYNPLVWALAEEMPQAAPPEDSTLCTAYDANSSVQLPIGGVLFVNIITLDMAGNIGR